MFQNEESLKRQLDRAGETVAGWPKSTQESLSLRTDQIVRQTQKLMVGRIKDGRVFIKTDIARIEFDAAMVNELIAGLLVAKDHKPTAG